MISESLIIGAIVNLFKAGGVCVVFAGLLVAGCSQEKNTPTAVVPGSTPLKMDLESMKERAEQGDPMYQVNLALMYANGERVPQDNVEALKWFRMAAEQGYPMAAYNLGVLYDNGNGVPEDDVEAYAWLFVAEYGRNQEAVERADSVAKELTPDQLTRAKALAGQYIDRYGKN
mgnify:CR=1 FL=1